MEFDLQSPIAQPSITKMVLTSSVYIFAKNSIIISWDGFSADGVLLRQGQDELSQDEVAAYFNTPLSPDGFRATFVAAFVGAIQAKYGSANVVS